jgi:hypothetical protein
MEAPLQPEPSPSDLILEKMIDRLSGDRDFGEETIAQIRRLAEAGRLSRPKDVARALAASGGDDENPSP